MCVCVCVCVYVCVSFPFWFEIWMWDLIVFNPNHCLFIYLVLFACEDGHSNSLPKMTIMLTKQEIIQIIQ